MAEALSAVSTASYILAVVFSIISVFLWIRFRILDVIGDLSGRTAKKSITRLREMNEKNGAKHKEAVYSTNERKEKIDNSLGTGLLSENRENNVSVSAQTGLLAGETMEIGSPKKTSKEIPEEETSELKITHTKDSNRKSDKLQEIGFELIEEIIFIHTDEVPD